MEVALTKQRREYECVSYDAAHDPCSDLAERMHQCFERLLREPLELTTLMLKHRDTSLEFPLGAHVVAPRTLCTTDVELAVLHCWCEPFRLVRVVVCLPMDYSSLDSADLGAATQCLIGNTATEATLQVPCDRTASNSGADSDPCIHKLQTVIHGSHGSGSPKTLRIPATGHIHTTTCNHKRGRAKAVLKAAHAGNAAALERALVLGGSTEEFDEIHGTAVFAAAHEGHLEAVRILVEAGADLNHCGESGLNPLHGAAARGHLHVVQALLEIPRINPREKDKNGYTPLHYAAEHGHLPVVQALIRDPRVDPGEAGKDDNTPLHYAANEDRLSVVQALIRDPRVHPGAKTIFGYTPLHYAAGGGHLSVVQALLGDPRVNPGEMTEDGGQTPLDCAKEDNHADVMRVLTAAIAERLGRTGPA